MHAPTDRVLAKPFGNVSSRPCRKKQRRFHYVNLWFARLRPKSCPLVYLQILLFVSRSTFGLWGLQHHPPSPATLQQKVRQQSQLLSLGLSSLLQHWNHSQVGWSYARALQFWKTFQRNILGSSAFGRLGHKRSRKITTQESNIFKYVESKPWKYFKYGS